MHEPSGVVAPLSLSWIPFPEATTRQVGYRIRVVRGGGERPESLFSGDGLHGELLWDSGLVESAVHLDISYGGGELRSGERAYWEVELTGDDGRVATSEVATWLTGVVQRADWSARWIGRSSDSLGPLSAPQPGEEDPSDVLGRCPVLYFRRQFDCGSAPRRAWLYASARGLYRLSLNGRPVGEDLLAPGWTDYHRRVQYQTHDVTKHLSAGANVIAVAVGEGWYCGYIGWNPKRPAAHYGLSPELLVQVEMEFDDGRRETVITDNSWRVGKGPIVSSDLNAGERYDARIRIDGWERPGFAGPGWFTTDETDTPPVDLDPQSADAIRVVQVLEPVSEQRRGELRLLDFGQNIAGWVRWRFEGLRAGQHVVLRHGEALDADGSLYTENLRSARQRDEYIADGAESASFEPCFTYHGFRYVEISGINDEVGVSALACVVSADIPTSASLECSDPLVSRLHSNILWTQRANFLSVPTDCPQRDERLGWLGDAQLFCRTAAFNADVSRFYDKWMTDVMDAQSPRGAFPNVAPRMGEWTDGAPVWADAGVIVPWLIYLHYGWEAIIQRCYTAAKRWFYYVLESNPNLERTHRSNLNFGDWLAIGEDTDRELIATAYFAHDAALLAKMAAILGRASESAELEALRAKIVDAFWTTFGEAEGRLRGDTQTAYATAIHLGLTRSTDETSLAGAHLAANIERNGSRLTTGIVGVRHLLPALSLSGHDDLAYRLLLSTGYPSWGYSIVNGATTIWERWDGWSPEDGFQTGSMNSFNHYALGSVGEWLFRFALGIDTTESGPGFAELLVRPRPSRRLASMRCTLNTVQGPVVSGWQHDPVGTTYEISVPSAASAMVTLQAPHAAATEAARIVEQDDALKVTSVERDALTFSAGPGRHVVRIEGGPIL
jgi:alpha-L-rhamnosidase